MTKLNFVPTAGKKKSRQRSADERRLRKQVRALIHQHKQDTITEDELVRLLYELVDDERRRVYAGMPVTFKGNGKDLIQSLSSL